MVSEGSVGLRMDQSLPADQLADDAIPKSPSAPGRDLFPAAVLSLSEPPARAAARLALEPPPVPHSV
jgi:hypothetical protein